MSNWKCVQSIWWEDGTGMERKQRKTAQNSHQSEKKGGIKSSQRFSSTAINSFPQDTSSRRCWCDMDLARWMLEQKDLQLRTLHVANVSCLEVTLLWGRIRLAKVILITQIEQKTVRNKRSKAMKSPCQWNSSNESWGYPTNMSIWKLIVHATQSWTFPSNGQSVVKWRLPCDVSKRFKKA